MNKYIAYGLVFESDYDLAPLTPVADDLPVDVLVRRSDVSSKGLSQPDAASSYTQIDASEVWLDIPGICWLLISNGRQIQVDPNAGADDDDVRLYILGSAMGAILHQRGFLVLHANAIYVDDGAVLFAGDSGAGKSTTAAVLHQMGYQVLSDDVVAIDDRGFIVGGFPQIKLWRDALDSLNISPDGLQQIRLQQQKYRFPLPPGRQNLQLPVKAIYFLEVAEEDEQHMVEKIPLGGMEKFTYLNGHTYRRQFMEGLGLKPRHLGLCTMLAEKTPMARLTRPRNGFTAKALAELVLQDLRERGLSALPTTGEG